MNFDRKKYMKIFKWIWLGIKGIVLIVIYIIVAIFILGVFLSLFFRTSPFPGD